MVVVLSNGLVVTRVDTRAQAARLATLGRQTDWAEERPETITAEQHEELLAMCRLH